MPKRSWFLAYPIALVACGAAPLPQLTAADVVRSEVVPQGYRSVGTARAHCERAPAWGRLSGKPLASFDCSFDGLVRELTEQAAVAGASVLAAVRCRGSSRGGRSCSGTMARATEPGPAAGQGAAPAAGAAGDRVLSSELRHSIAVDLEPTRQSFARRPRPASEVGEALTLPVSHVELGSIRTRCAASACEVKDLRLALRMAAGGLGVSDLVGVSCATLAGEHECLATLSATELDPETDARAR